MTILEKYLEVIKNELMILSKKIGDLSGSFFNLNKGIDNLSRELKNQKAPIVNVSVPDIHVPEIKIPEIKVPQPKVNVTVPEIKLPEIKVPTQKIEFPGEIKIKDIENILGRLIVKPEKVDIAAMFRSALEKAPIKVVLVDSSGKEKSIEVGSSNKGARSMIGGGYNNPFTFAPSGELVTINGVLGAYETVDSDDYTTANVTYIGQAKTDGTYLIYKIDETTGLTKRAANKGNNEAKKTYAQAWPARTTLNYDYIFNLTNL